MRTLGMPNGLAAVAWDRSDTPALVEGTLPRHRVTKLSPRPADRDDLTGLFEDSLTIWACAGDEDPGKDWGLMLTRCLFCHGRFPENRTLTRLPRAGRIAFDPRQGRLWLICARCRRWNLAPVEERGAAIHELERLARDQGRTLGSTANVVLLRTGALELVRIGRAGLGERAAWRYGRELRKRKSAFESRSSRIAAYTLGAMQYLGEAMGVADPDLSIDWDDAPVADVLRWRRFGWAAWHGRETCPSCLSTLRALRYDLAWWVYPLRGPEGRLGVGIPCQRCDPWTPDKVYELHGDIAENVLRRLLAYVNIGGASERRVADAVRRIEEVGSADDFTMHATDGRHTLWRLGAEGTVGLEIALNESVERRLLDLEARALEFLWRREEELARIIDEELSPGAWRAGPRGWRPGPRVLAGLVSG